MSEVSQRFRDMLAHRRQAYFTGGDDTACSGLAVDYFGLDSNTTMQAPNFTVSRSQHSIALYDSEIVACGGSSGLSSCESLSLDFNGRPAESAWKVFASLPAAVYDGCMLVVGGKVRLVVEPFA